jgi:hypothetical protein
MGDGYLAICHSMDHQVNSVRFCLQAIEVARTTPVIIDDFMRIRAAVDSGPVEAIVLDTVPYKYTLVGRTMETVKELDRTGRAAKVHCGQEVVDKLRHLNSLLFEIGPRDVSYFLSPKKDNSITADETIICPKTLRFFSVSRRMGALFEYTDLMQLRTFRMLQGPLTRMDAVQCALDQSFLYMCQTQSTVVLYTIQTSPVCASITVRHSFAIPVVGVLIDCKRVDHC